MHCGHGDMGGVLNRFAWHRTCSQQGPTERPGLVTHIEKLHRFQYCQSLGCGARVSFACFFDNEFGCHRLEPTSYTFPPLTRHNLVAQDYDIA